MMELKSSTINDTWKLCTLGGFLGFFALGLFLTSNPQTVQYSAAFRGSSTFIAFFTTSPSAPPPPPPAVATTASLQTTTTTTSSSVSSNNNTSQTDLNISSSPSTGGGDTSELPTLAPAPAVVGGTKEATLATKKREEDDESGGKEKDVVQSKPASSSTCNMFEGRWVYRPDVSPVYRVEECPFLEEKMSCRRNGRPDSDYEGWSWEATDCDIPLFNGTDMLVRLRGKRVIIAGDSLNRNQWESMACLVYASLHPSRVFVDADGSQYKVLKAMDYNFTLEFYWSPFLVDLDDTTNKKSKVMNLDRLVPSSDQWRGAHVMIFNSAHWWTHRDVWDVFQYNGQIIPDMPRELAYARALTTWSNWLSRNVDPSATAVFFRSISPEHKGKYWCLNATGPIPDESYVNNFPKEMIEVAEQKVAAVKWQGKGNNTPEAAAAAAAVTYLNITALSGYRMDAHPAIYRYKAWQKKMETVKVEMFADCSHWCLPGLPDTWNRLVYATLVLSSSSSPTPSSTNITVSGNTNTTLS